MCVFVLDDIETCTLEVFSDWLYTQQVPSTDLWANHYAGSIEFVHDERAIRLYILTDRFFVPELKPVAMRLLVSCYRKHDVPSFAAIKVAFNNLLPGNPVLKLLVDSYCQSNPSTFKTRQLTPFGDLPTDFLREAVKLYARQRPTIKDFKPRVEDYQEKTTSQGGDNKSEMNRKWQKTRSQVTH